MSEFSNVAVGLRRVESEPDFRFAIRCESDSERIISDLKGGAFTIPLPIEVLAYDPQNMFYLGMTRRGVTWRNVEEQGELDESEPEGMSGTIGKAPIVGAATFLDFFHGRFWCAGSDFQILSSQDGSNWETQLTREGVDAKHHPGVWTSLVGAKDEEIFAVGLDGVIGVFDGADWTLERVDGISFWDAIVIDEETVYACGSKGKLARRVDEEWEVISTKETESFISFARVGSQVYISTENTLFEFQIRGIHVHLNPVGAGGKLLVCDSTLFVLSESGRLSALSRGL